MGTSGRTWSRAPARGSRSGGTSVGRSRSAASPPETLRSASHPTQPSVPGGNGGRSPSSPRRPGAYHAWSRQPRPVTPMRFPGLLALSLAPLLLLEGGPASPADCNQNGIEDFQEIASGMSPDCNSNRVPDGCDILPVNYGPTSRQEIPFPEFPSRMIEGDFDEDGLPDLAILVSGRPWFALFRNNGLGGLEEARIQALEDEQESLTAVDFDS